MTAYVEFLGGLVRTCEQLRHAGLPDDRIEVFARRCVERASAAGLDEVVGRLAVLGETVRSGAADATAAFDDALRAMDGIGSIAGRTEVIGLAGENPAPAHGPKYPNVSVSLAGLEDQFWPVLRKVAYAMGDAGLDDAEIERYKSEMKEGDDPVGVSRRWVEIS